MSIRTTERVEIEIKYLISIYKKEETSTWKNSDVILRTYLLPIFIPGYGGGRIGMNFTGQ